MSGGRIYDFSQGSSEMSDLLGMKGANLAEMVSVLGPELIPEGFTVTTEACVEFLSGDGSLDPDLIEEIAAAVTRLELSTGRRLGDPDDPLLVSIRSGGAISMPGMMDTILNLGLNDSSVAGLARRSGSPRFAWDCFRRLTQMYANVVCSIPGDLLEEEIAVARRSVGARSDLELGGDDLRGLVNRFREMILASSGEPFPDDPADQLLKAIAAVFQSWNSPRAVSYRRIHGLPDHWGTAATVQRMVFGNLPSRSGSGVAFSRDETTGAPQASGDWLAAAQGEDVVSGSRDPSPLTALAIDHPAIWKSLTNALTRLEQHFRQIQDCEFTVEDGRLFILQARTAKRPAQASVRFACDSIEEGLLDEREALLSFDAGDLEGMLHPRLARPPAESEIVARGVAGSPGAATGPIVFSSEDALRLAGSGEHPILVRRRTEADDVAGFHAAAGILTSTGGKASHAALVARGMGRPCVCGANGLLIDAEAHELVLPNGDGVLREGDRLTIDGTSGVVTTASIPLEEPTVGEDFSRLLGIADSFRKLGVRVNADNAADAGLALRLGAEGIGLCRTEHMFMESDRQPLIRDVILAEDAKGRAESLAALMPMQQGDFEEILAVMDGHPVTIRLLDPPLHEFLREEGEIELAIDASRRSGDDSAAAALQRELRRTVELRESNPMLGARGVRLGLIHPEIYEMQVKALARAAISTRERTGRRPRLEVMVPLVAWEREFALARRSILDTAAAEGLDQPGDLSVGTMIELPRACFAADLIAAQADFFSFGTNDLTQTALGMSRDDVEAEILPAYCDLGIVTRSPFSTIDPLGVGELVRLAAGRGRSVRSDLGLGVCGEHGGDPDSIAFFAMAGVDHVSCSPYRVPVARVAAAQAAIRSADLF